MKCTKKNATAQSCITYMTDINTNKAAVVSVGRQHSDKLISYVILAGA